MISVKSHLRRTKHGKIQVRRHKRKMPIMAIVGAIASPKTPKHLKEALEEKYKLELEQLRGRFKSHLKKDLMDEPYEHGVKAIMSGLLIRNKKEKAEVVKHFTKQGYQPPKILDSYKTLAGLDGEGGRNDVIVQFHMKDIPKLAISSEHLGGLFRWHDDYYVYNHSIVPEKAKKYFKDVTYKLEGGGMK